MWVHFSFFSNIFPIVGIADQKLSKNGQIRCKWDFYKIGFSYLAITPKAILLKTLNDHHIPLTYYEKLNSAKKIEQNESF